MSDQEIQLSKANIQMVTVNREGTKRGWVGCDEDGDARRGEEGEEGDEQESPWSKNKKK